MALTLKKFLLKDENWYRYCQYHEDKIRPCVKYSINKVLSCRSLVRGHAQYTCSNPSCTHQKLVPFSCKDRSCSACGKIATDAWLIKQQALLPPCPFQHVTFTMPKILSQILLSNRQLINRLPALTGKILNKIANRKGVQPGIFLAIHTFGRALNWHVHLHVSVTRGGLSKDNTWKDLFFKKHNLMLMWRYEVIHLLRNTYQKGELNRCIEMGKQLFPNIFTQQYQKYWQVHCAKPHNNPKKDLAYLARYIKRPAIANSRLAHYSGDNLVFKFLNHRTQKMEYTSIDAFEFIDRFTQHMPEKGFRLIRYFGFLANRLRATLLPIVSELFNHQPEIKKRSWVQRVKNQLGINPLECILCHNLLQLNRLTFGLSSKQLMTYQKEIALQKHIRPNLAKI